MSKLLIVLLVVIFGYAQAALPDNYESLTALEKQTILWENIVNDPYPVDDVGNYPNETGAGEADNRTRDPDFLQEVFLPGGDELPPGRPKLISPHGVAFKCELIIHPGSPYTGVWESGSRIGICRLSDGGGLIPENRLAPFLAVKVLVNGQRSKNTFSGWNIVGQFEGNRTSYWRDEMTTGYDATQDSFDVPGHPEFLQIFLDVVADLPGGGPLDRPRNTGDLGCVESSWTTQQGANATTPLAPFRIGWTPTDITKTFDQTEPNYRNQVTKMVKPDTMLWTVTAQRSPCDQFQPFGEMWVRSKMVAGHYEDQILRFQQPRRQWDPTYLVPGGMPCPTGACGVNDGSNICPAPYPSGYPDGTNLHLYQGR